MSGTGTGYDLSCTTFSPDGRVFQVEYAVKTVEKSGLAVGLQCKDGVVLGVEKILLSDLLKKKSNRRIFTCDTHIGMALAGYAADARQLANRAREEAQNYQNFYGNKVPGKILVNRVSQYVHAHTLYYDARPFGCSVIFAAYDRDEPSLWKIDPSGVSYQFRATAMGKHRASALTELEKLDHANMTCREAVKKVAECVMKFHDDIKDKRMKLELSWVCDESKRKHEMVPKDIYDEALAHAQEVKRRADMESDDDE